MLPLLLSLFILYLKKPLSIYLAGLAYYDQVWLFRYRLQANIPMMHLIACEPHTRSVDCPRSSPSLAQTYGLQPVLNNPDLTRQT